MVEGEREMEVEEMVQRKVEEEGGLCRWLLGFVFQLVVVGFRCHWS